MSTKTNEDTKKLISVVQQIALAQKEDQGLHPYENHCLINNNVISATNGVVSASSAIDIDFHTAPNTHKLLAALKHCTKDVNITMLNAATMSIKSGAFRVNVPCIPVGEIPYVFPDKWICGVNDDLKRALEIASSLAVRDGETVIESSILLTANTAVGTNRISLIEVWHGWNLQQSIVLPKSSVQTLAKVNKPLKAFGLSTHSVSFLFEDDSWIKTQLYTAEWPDVAKFFAFAAPPQMQDFPQGFFDAVAALAPHAKAGFVWFGGDKMQTAISDGQGAVYDLPGLPADFGLDIKSLQFIKGVAKQIAFEPKENITYFEGDRLRGVLCQAKDRSKL